MDDFIIADIDGVALHLSLNEWAARDASARSGCNVEIIVPSEDVAPLLFFGADDLARIGIAFLKAAAFLEHRDADRKLKDRINTALTGKGA